MIVECGKCGTRFQLDDARVPESGIRVRCSRCKKAFFLQHPSATPDDVIQDVVERTVAQPEQPPDSSEEQGYAPEESDSLDVGSADESGLAGPEDDDLDFEEEDWEFNSDLPEPDGAGAGAGLEAGALQEEDLSDDHLADEAPADDSAPFGDLSDGDSLRLADDDFDTVPGLAGNEAPGSEAFPAPEEPPISQQAEPALASEESRPAPALDASEDARDVFGSPADFSSLSEPEPPAAEAEGGESAFSDLLAESDSDDPEDWNFLTEDAPGGQAASIGRVQLTSRDALEAEEERGANAAEDEAAPLTGAVQSDVARRVGQGVGWLLTVGLCAVGAIQGLSLALPTAEPIAAEIRLGDLTAGGIAGSWIETARGERLYAVRGTLENPGARAVRPQGLLEVVLLDASGETLTLPPVQAVRMLRDAELRELSGEALQVTRTRAGRDFVATAIGPGRSLPFVALFEGLPDEASAFQVRAAPLPDFTRAARPAPVPALAEVKPVLPVAREAESLPATTPVVPAAPVAPAAYPAAYPDSY